MSLGALCADCALGASRARGPATLLGGPYTLRPDCARGASPADHALRALRPSRALCSSGTLGPGDPRALRAGPTHDTLRALRASPTDCALRASATRATSRAGNALQASRALSTSDGGTLCGLRTGASRAPGRPRYALVALRPCPAHRTLNTAAALRTAALRTGGTLRSGDGRARRPVAPGTPATP